MEFSKSGSARTSPDGAMPNQERLSTQGAPRSSTGSDSATTESELNLLVTPSQPTEALPSNNSQARTEPEIPSAKPRATASEYLRTAITSSAVWSGAGAAIFCLETSLLAVGGHLAVGWQTLRNEVQLSRGAGAAPSRSGPDEDGSRGLPGYRGLLSDTLKSPAFNTIATGLCYLAAAGQCFASGQLFEGSILTTYFCGLMAMSNAIGASYSGTRSTHTLAEKGFRAAWRAVPERLQVFLKNPSVWLAAGNLPLVGVACNLGDIAANPLVTAPAVVGLLLSEFGLLTAVKTLVWDAGPQSTTADTSADAASAKKREAASFAQGLLLNSAGHLLVGASSLMQGALYIGAAKVCWCIACGILGLQKRAEATAPEKRNT